jgi:hypothetical protein
MQVSMPTSAASPCSLAGPYDNSMPELTLSPQSGSMDSAIALVCESQHRRLIAFGQINPKKDDSITRRPLPVNSFQERCSSFQENSVRCFKQIWRVGKVGKVGKVGWEGR